jgi:uroporphyrinogen-III synthase
MDATLPLTGFTVGVTAARRADELGSLLTRRGAAVLHAPALRIVPLADDTALRAATLACLEKPLDYTVASTGIGFRGWLEAADGWDMSTPLLQRLKDSALFSRGPKATGAMRAAGLTEVWSPPSESSGELLSRLLQENLPGTRVAVQEHGEPMADFAAALRNAGAEVIEVPVYRWARPTEIQPLQRMVEAIVDGTVDAITFTSAPAVNTLLGLAERSGDYDRLINTLQDSVLAACVGPICAEPLSRAGVTCAVPERYRLGALVRVLTESLPQKRERTVHTGRHELRIRGSAVLVDGTLIALPRREISLLRALAAEPGRVLTREELLRIAWPADGPSNGHAVETTIGRLRTALGPAAYAIQTVVKRGYRLAA